MQEPRLVHLGSRCPADHHRLADITTVWPIQYGYRSLLLETFVEQSRFRGTAYQAANWICLGQTTGRGKLNAHYQVQPPIKTV
ncbi:MAG: hypothetical protein AW12_01048 [Candidatus Accumulibacter sp. BA-94]|nr:MAG: hypothetical protein AW12_01048 [Candidatus Accumulibacter sp. BA-94]